MWSLHYTRTEKFPQATSDYTSALSLKSSLLPPWSRQIAEAHYKLCIVLDLSSGRLEEAIAHAGRAVGCVEGRLAQLRSAVQQKSAEGGENGQAKEGEEKKVEGTGKEEVKDAKGKQKAHSTLLPEDDLRSLTAAQLAAEIRELEGLRDDLVVKVRLISLLFFLYRGCEHCDLDASRFRTAMH